MTDDLTSHRVEMDAAFRNGNVAGATPEQLERWLQSLCTGNVPNETVRHREIIRGLTINHVQMARTIRELEDAMNRLNAANEQTQKLILWMTGASLFASGIQAGLAIWSFMK